MHHPHDALEVQSTSEVSVETPPRPDGVVVAWEELGPRLDEDPTEDALLARVCRLESPLVETSAAVATYAAPSFPPGRPVVEAVTDLTTRIFTDFTFDPAFSDVSTPLAEVLDHRRGVCQDFAHLAIGCLRSVGLPARYVSGYIETEAAARPAQAGRRRRLARLVSRRTCRAGAGSTSTRPTTRSPRPATSPWPGAATTATSRRSAVSSSAPPRPRSSRSPSTSAVCEASRPRTRRQLVAQTAARLARAVVRRGSRIACWSRPFVR